MAVGSSTVSDAAQRGQVSSTPRPVRTCIGCRKRASAAELLRVVVTSGAIGQAHARPEGDRGPVALPVVPDPRRRAPGRGAWLHRDLECVELAERRRAFARALRVPGPVDPTPVREYLAAPPGTSTSGIPQE
ncbi:YlxR family protein [Jatrophihabitans cynanchi]|uniref:YlxR family protein n=1 Tax=Jatrophihabitans cynanchi TaxID=2944128 RepID=A0ABY7K314_9ACTN|nr:YlxR family protein [Jatrophihabitans sp. SB3-54]WAX57516.1 YlxR family protein [Jatrophihabitans sp. SB3-54]